MHAGHGAARASFILSFPEVGHSMPQGMVWPAPCRTTAARVTRSVRARVACWGLIGLHGRRRYLVGDDGSALAALAPAPPSVRSSSPIWLGVWMWLAFAYVFCTSALALGIFYVVNCFPFPQRPRRRLTPPYWLPTALPTPSRRRARARAARATRSGARLSRAGTGRKSHCTALLGAHSGCVAVGAGIRPTAALLVRCWRTMARSGLNSGRAQAS